MSFVIHEIGQPQYPSKILNDQVYLPNTEKPIKIIQRSLTVAEIL